MKNRKQKVIDKKFQHGKSFRITSFAAIITAVIIIAVGFSISVNNSKIQKNNERIAENTTMIKGIIGSQQNIFIQYSLLPRAKGILPPHDKTRQMVEDYNANVEKLNRTVKSNHEIVASNNKIMTINTTMVVAIILMTALGMGLLYWRLINETHRISGPIFLMTRHMKEIFEGKSPDMRNLRDDDEFKEFYELFREMARRLIDCEKTS